MNKCLKIQKFNTGINFFTFGIPFRKGIKPITYPKMIVKTRKLFGGKF